MSIIQSKQTNTRSLTPSPSCVWRHRCFYFGSNPSNQEEFSRLQQQIVAHVESVLDHLCSTFNEQSLNLHRTKKQQHECFEEFGTKRNPWIMILHIFKQIIIIHSCNVVQMRTEIFCTFRAKRTAFIGMPQPPKIFRISIVCKNKYLLPPSTPPLLSVFHFLDNDNARICSINIFYERLYFF